MNDKRNTPTAVGTQATVRGDLHTHSTASPEPKLGAGRALTLGSDDEQRLLLTWLAELGFELDTASLTSTLQAGDFSPSNLARRPGKTKPVTGEGDLIRVAVVTDGLRSFPSGTQALDELRAHISAGLEVDVIGVPSLFSVAEALSARSYDVVHVCAPGPVGVAAALISGAMGIPIAGAYPIELQTPARVGSGDLGVKPIPPAVLAAFYSQCRIVLSPNSAADASLARLGISAERTLRWDQGIDLDRFNPAQQTRDILPAGFKVLYVGGLSPEPDVDLLAEAFLAARDRDARLHLVVVGRGPEEPTLRRRLGSAVTFLGRLDGDALARVYASADLFMFASTTDTVGQVILKAQASGLPVLAVDAGASARLIEDGRSGCLVAPEAGVLASALGGLARRAAIRDRLATGGLRAVREHSRKRSLAQLADAYARAIAAQPDSDRGIERDTAATLEAARAA